MPARTTTVRHLATTSAQADTILCALAAHYLLTSFQLCRICGYAPASIRLLRNRLRGLELAGFVVSQPAPRTTENGRAPRLYSLGRKGRAYVAELGIDLPRRHRPSEQAQLGYQMIQHSLAVSDFLIQAQLLARRRSSIHLDEFLHDRTLQRMLTRSPAVPDGWLDFRGQSAPGAYRKCLALELDRGFHRQVAWRKKITALLAWAAPDGPYQKQFGTPSLTILVVATRAEWSSEQSAKRRDQLRAWTAAELAARNADDQADLFRFTSLNPATASAEDLFLRPNWYRPDSDRRALPLFDDVTPAAA